MSTARHRIFPLLLLSLTATACQDQLVTPDERTVVPRPQFAQGDGGVWTVNTLIDGVNGACDEVECTLREALGAAASGDRIVFAPSLEGDVVLTMGPLVLFAKGLSVDGDSRIIVDAGGIGDRAFFINGGNTPVEVRLTGLTIKDANTTTQISGPGAGIGVFDQAHLHLDRVTVENNSSPDEGGGVYVDSESSLTLFQSTIRGNNALMGGGVYSDGQLTVIASTISGNVGRVNGGGIYDSGEIASIVGSTISGNRAGTPSVGVGRGGGVYAAGETSIRSTTITLNDAKGQDGYSGGLHAEGRVQVANSIIIGNRSDEGDEDCGGPGILRSLGYTLRRINNCQFDVSAGGDVHVETAQFFTEVLEQELKDNGGPTLTHALILRGRAVDAGYCPGETTDQRGLTRPVDDLSMPNALDGCDIGAYEVQGPFVARTDLIISQSANKTSVKQGDLLTYTVRVRNLGPETAPNVVVTNVLSTGVTFVSATHTKGSHTAPPVGETGTVTWYLGDMLDQANETTEIQVTVRIKGRTTVTNTASVTSDAVDPNTANNTAGLTVSVAAGSTKPPSKGK